MGKRVHLSVTYSTVTLLAVGALAGCATSNSTGNGTSQKPVSIEFMTYAQPANPHGQAKMLRKFIAEFEKQNPNIRVSYQTYTSASQEVSDINNMAASHQGPTVIDASIVSTAYATGEFYNFGSQQWNLVGGKAEYFPEQFTEAGPNPQNLIAVPWSINPYGLIYNKTMFAEAGIKSPPTTWTQFVNDAEKLTNPSKGQWGTGIDPADPIDPWHINWVMTRQLGGNFLNNTNTKATLASGPVDQALSFWFDWVTKFHIASPQDLTWQSTDLLTAFENGKIAMLPMQSYSLVPALETSKVKNDWALAPMPTVPYGMKTLPPNGVPVQGFVAGGYFEVPKYVTGAQYTAAMKWIKFFNDVPQQREMFQTYGLLPVNVNAYKNYAPLDTPVINSLVTAESHAYPYPFTGSWGTVEVDFGAVANKIASELATNTFKSGDIETLLQAADQELQSSLQNK